MKLEEKLEENSDLSENDEPIEYNIEDFLAPQEKELLRRDPYNLNYLATIWTNEATLLKAKSEFEKWINDSVDNGYWATFYQLIFKVSDANALFKWRRVCKLSNALVIQANNIWRDLFYNSRRWKLHHDLGNDFFGIDPKSENKKKWKNVIPDDQIDWFGEYRRNHIHSVAIHKAIEDIKAKLHNIIEDYGVVKQDVASPAFFEPGVTDEEIDAYCSKNKLSLTNDIRELLKARIIFYPIDRF